MQVFLLGASGLIGAGIAKALKARGHRVLGLSRTEATADKLTAAGVEPVPGDLRAPDGWVAAALACDGLINAGGTFDEEMGAVETAVAERLLPGFAIAGKPYVATGGIWLYPAAGPQPHDESAPHDPTPGFEWAPALLAHIHAAGGRIVHPAAVWRRDGALLERLLDPAMLASGTVPIAGGPHVRWPLVEADDLGRLYAEVLERGAPGGQWFAAAEPGTPQEDLAQAVERGLGRRLGRHILHVADLIADEGRIAAGFARDLWVDAGRALRDFAWRPRAEPAARVLERLARDRA